MADPELIKQINSLIPALVVVYNINTGHYIYVNEASFSILGYKKTTFLKKGLPFIGSLVHPDDLPEIMEQNQIALKKANKPPFSPENDRIPLTFEYRMRHKNGSWKWLHSDGIVFQRDSKGKVEYVMNISIDITERKKAEDDEKQKRDQAENEKNTYYQDRIRLMRLRSEIADVLRKDTFLNKTLEKCLSVVVKNLPATFCRIWLLNPENQLLELASSSGNSPPLETIRKKLNLGDYAVGRVAQYNHAYISNNILTDKNFQVQNNKWSKENNITSFAGYPLTFQNKTIGVITAFAGHNFSENTLISLGNVADILAQEIERKRIETKLHQSQLRYASFIKQSSEGIWRFEVEKPISIKLTANQQIDQFYEYAYLAECNDALAKMYGFQKAEDIIGARLGDLLTRDNPNNYTYLKNFISSSYNLSNAESVEIDQSKKPKYLQNSLIGIVKEGFLVRAWGIQRDITSQKKADQELQKMSKQKDEFIAIASHELKTPLTSLKAYTQVLENKFHKHGDIHSATLLHKMDKQFNRLIVLIGDLLDISKMEAGKMQFDIKQFKINPLIKEIVEQLQQTTSNHKLVTKLGTNLAITGDKNRIGQVLINFISNAIKYSPDNKQIIIQSQVEKNYLTVSVHDFGIGINKQDQSHVFERFYRSSSSKKASFPGLGLGLYICKEIIERHGGKVGVTSLIGRGSKFFFTIPIKTS